MKVTENWFYWKPPIGCFWKLLFLRFSNLCKHDTRDTIYCIHDWLQMAKEILICLCWFGYDIDVCMWTPSVTVKVLMPQMFEEKLSRSNYTGEHFLGILFQGIILCQGPIFREYSSRFRRYSSGGFISFNFKW